MSELLRRILFIPDAASTFSSRIDNLHFFVITTTMIASAGVGATALFFFVRYRRKTEHQVTPRVIPRLGVELAFIVVPLIFFLLWFAIGFRDFVYMTTPPKNAMDVYVMGKQWMWKFTYPEGPNAVSVLRVPAHRPIRLLMTSRDVIHSFFVPEFRIKQDVLPGRYTQAWFEATKPGRYQVLCTEYCGLNHSTMWGEVVVMEPAEFEEWMATQKNSKFPDRDDGDPVAMENVPPTSSLVTQGQRVAARHGCLKCHTVDGSRHIGPTWVDMYMTEQNLTTGEKVLRDEGYLTRSMMDPLAQIAQGYQPVMPSFHGQLSPGESAALVEYIKSLSSMRVTHELTSPSYEPIRAQ